MKSINFCVLLALIGLMAVHYACSTEGSGDSSDGGGDGDSDSGTTDMDSDSSSDTDCGGIDELCCNGSECDDAENMTCATLDDENYFCFENCTPSTCDYGGEIGICQDFGQMAFCISGGMSTSSCEPDEENCETEYGVDENTYCAASGSDTYCLEFCEPKVTGCDAQHYCSPLTDDSGGVCIPTNT